MQRSTRTPDTRQVRASIHPVTFYRAELPAMPTPRHAATGWTDGGLCPFHHDRHAGSFRVNLSTGAYTCFSCAAHGGDVIAFTMARYSLPFRDALARLCNAWGIR